MGNKKIIIVSDYNFKGSGYLNIAVPISEKLSQLGYDIKAVGLGYQGDEHWFGFSLIPCQSFPDAYAMVNNLKYQWQPDLVIVALDIPHQIQFHGLCKNLGLKMIAITPLENPPLTFSWANLLTQIDKVFFISQLGEDEAKKAGVETAEHLVVGMDTVSWRLRTQEEYTKGREMLNISPETLVVFTVADNQERKNLSKAYEIVARYKSKVLNIPWGFDVGEYMHKETHVPPLKEIKYILVTRENSDVGWKLRDLGMTYKVPSEVMLMERGLPFAQLYALYAISDVFLLTSKAEGLCEPVLEAMSIGIPVVATACGSMPELLGTEYYGERGFLMDTEYSMIDPWGNSRRDFPLAESGENCLEMIAKSTSPLVCITRARMYMEERTWDKPIQQLVGAIEALTNEEKQTVPQ